MDWHVWLGFVAVSALIGLIPGPGVMSIVGCALSSGLSSALAAVAGMAVGNAVAMTLSLLGVGALLAASASAFAIVKWTGALYLIGLGSVAVVRSRGAVAETHAMSPLSPRAAFVSTVAVGVFHPKTIVFFVAFVPQFIRPGHGYAAQASLLVATFCTVVGGTDAFYALAASRAAAMLRRPRALAWVKRLGGGVLIASGIATAAART